VSWGANRIDCFVRGEFNAMWHIAWDGTRWSDWDNRGGGILEAPNCVSWGANRIDCFARGAGKEMFHMAWDGTQWGGWENLDGELLNAPNCVSWGANRIDCFARGTAAAMYHNCPSCLNPRFVAFLRNKNYDINSILHFTNDDLRNTVIAAIHNESDIDTLILQGMNNEDLGKFALDWVDENVKYRVTAISQLLDRK
jgi:hypothetical protein